MPVTLRAATASDQKPIKDLIHLVGINPTGLKWQRFIIAEEDGQFVGCVQLKPHNERVRELASLAVKPSHQAKGIGSQLIRALLAREPGEIYLTCRSSLSGYYARFGFEIVGIKDMPGSFIIQYRIINIITKFAQSEGLSVMRRPG